MKYDKELIGKNIKKEREKRHLSQSALGEKIHVAGKQISNYENGKLFPPIESLLNLCEVFNCELGFLLGEPEYLKGTKIDTEVSNYTGLTQESIDNIKMITGSERKCIEFGYQSKAYTSILNKLLSSEKLIPLVENVLQLDSTYATANGCEWKNIEKEIGKKRMDTALYNYNNPGDDDSNDSLAIQEENYDFNLVAGAQDRQYNAGFYVEMCRYEVWERFSDLMEELYPKTCNTP